MAHRISKEPAHPQAELQIATRNLRDELAWLRHAAESDLVLNRLMEAAAALIGADIQPTWEQQRAQGQQFDLEDAIQACSHVRKLLYHAINEATTPLEVSYDGEEVTLTNVGGAVIHTRGCASPQGISCRTS